MPEILDVSPYRLAEIARGSGVELSGAPHRYELGSATAAKHFEAKRSTQAASGG
jgi:hypothetical protein